MEVYVMQEKASFGKYIREKRIEKGLSQQQLAEMLYVSESAVSKWERGANYPDITMISDLCKALEINEHELVTASTDTEYRKLQKDAKKFNNLSKASYWTVLICYAVALLACFICNIAVNHTLDWFFVVLSSLICAFSFFPTFSRFFAKHKLEIFLLTTFVSIGLVLFTCGIFVGDATWVPVSIVGTLMLYFSIFAPILFVRLKLSKTISRFGFLFYVLGMLALTVAVLATTQLVASFSFIQALMITAYCFVPFILSGLVFALNIDTFIKVSICILLTAIAGYGCNKFLSIVFKSNDYSQYTVDFSNWNECVSGNVNFIIFGSFFIIAVVFAVIGIIRSVRKSSKKS